MGKSYLKVFTVLLFFGNILSFGQSIVKVPFKLINNQIIIPIEINEKGPYNFILDSGSKYTVIVKDIPNQNFKYTQSIKLKGLGADSAIIAKLTSGNRLFLKESIKLKPKNILVIQDHLIDLDSKFDMPIHGIIGYDLLSKYRVTINYASQCINFSSFKRKFKNKNKYKAYHLTFHKGKPYINSYFKINNHTIKGHLLIDTGSSDALWLFSNSHKNIKIPVNNFESILGYGFNGMVTGKVAQIDEFSLGTYKVKKPMIAFPNESSVSYVRNYKKRNGSIGGQILRIYKVVFDYKAKKVYLKKRFFSKVKFYYNKVGFTILKKNIGINIYIVQDILENSNAYKEGLRAGDIINSLNELSWSDLNLTIFHSYFNYKYKGNIKLEITRGNKKMNIEF